jgi:hypothetical protein
MARPKAMLELSEGERSELQAQDRAGRGAALRARIVLACAEGIENNTVAERLQMTKADCLEVARALRARSARRPAGCASIGARRATIDDARVEAVVTRSLESKPAGATQRSTRLMAREMGMTQNAILGIWHAFGLQPHRQEAFKLSADPMFVDKVRDIVGLYLTCR